MVDKKYQLLDSIVIPDIATKRSCVQCTECHDMSVLLACDYDLYESPPPILYCWAGLDCLCTMNNVFKKANFVETGAKILRLDLFDILYAERSGNTFQFVAVSQLSRECDHCFGLLW